MIINDEITIKKKLEESRSVVNENPSKAMGLCKEAFEMAKSENLPLMEAEALICMAIAARARSDRGLLLDYSYQAMDKFRDLGNKEGLGKAYNLIGVAYFYSSMYEDSIRNFMRSLESIKGTENRNLTSSIYNNIGEVYRESSMYEEALEYYHESLKIADLGNLISNKAIIMGNIGEVYQLMGNLDSALLYFDESRQLLHGFKDFVSLGEIHSRIGKVNYLKGLFDEAKGHYSTALKYLEDIDNSFYRIDVLQNIAELTEDANERISILKEAVTVASSVSSKKKLTSLYKLLSQEYEGILDFRSALKYHKRFCDENEMILKSNIKDKLEIIEIELKYMEESEKFEQIRMTLEKELEYGKIELERTRTNNALLEKEAFEDELTEVPNRRSINRYLRTLLNNYKGEHATIALYMMDIDHFKRYNDNWGHAEGDDCLRKIARTVDVIAKKRQDIFGRYGGEEFVYIAKISSFEEAESLGEIIRRKIESLSILYDNVERNIMTVSIGGVFGNTDDFKGFPQIMEKADRELYRAKAEGRNRVNMINSRSIL